MKNEQLSPDNKPAVLTSASGQLKFQLMADQKPGFRKLVLHVDPDNKLAPAAEVELHLSSDEALEIARMLVYGVALARCAFGTAKDGELQDALSQAFAWIENSRAAMAAPRTAPSSDKLN